MTKGHSQFPRAFREVLETCLALQKTSSRSYQSAEAFPLQNDLLLGDFEFLRVVSMNINAPTIGGPLSKVVIVSPELTPSEFWDRPTILYIFTVGFLKKYRF